jgi:hypothetical protein
MRLARNHVLKTGFQFTSTSWTQSYTYGRDGIFQFGDLDQFGNAEGTYFRTVSSSDVAEFRSTDWGLFGQDAWEVDRGIIVTIGIGWSRQKLPTKSSDNPINPEYRVPERLQPAEPVHAERPGQSGAPLRPGVGR